MANKMILIPEDIWEKVNAKPNILINSLNDLELQITLLLDSDRFTDYEKVQLINQIQNRYNKVQLAHTQNKINENIKQEVNNESIILKNNQNIRNRILNLFTKTSKKRGEQLLFLFENNKKINWNKKDELIINRNIIEKSNIIDLLILTVSNKSKINLVGINEYINLLIDINVSNNLIVNNKIKELIDLKLKKNQENLYNNFNLIWEEEI